MPTHVAFGCSAFASLKRALQALGNTDRLVRLVDNLGLGPIAVVAPVERARWEFVDAYPDLEADIQADAAVYRELEASTDVLVTWLSMRDASERCGFMELLRRVGHRRILVVDVGDVAFARPFTNLRMGYVRESEILEHDLLSTAVPLMEAAAVEHLRVWDRLQSENGAIRLLTDGRFSTVPIDHYDERVLSLVNPTWQRCARVVGDTMGLIYEAHDGQAVTDTFVFDRLLRLMEREDIESRCDEELWSMQNSHVRSSPPT